MDNYVYIVAGLPDLVLSFESSEFSYDAVRDYFYQLLSEKDQQTIALLEEGFDETALNEPFYAKAAQSKNRFIREYFDFDGRMRNLKVNYLAKRLGKESDPYLMNFSEADFEEEKQILEIFENPDFVQREQKMDELKWEKANDIARMDYFNLNVILAFLVKAKIVQRWAVLDQEHGSEMFATLVKEVKGTFDGIQFKQKN